MTHKPSSKLINKNDRISRYKYLHIICSLIIGITIISCYKKKKEAIVGTYSGQERHVRFHYWTPDTISDSTYEESIKVELFDKKWFKFTKSEYPHSFEMCANKLIRKDSITITPGLFPPKEWKIYITGDSLYGIFTEDNGWAGSNDHYYFSGRKI